MCRRVDQAAHHRTSRCRIALIGGNRCHDVEFVQHSVEQFLGLVDLCSGETAEQRQRLAVDIENQCDEGSFDELFRFHRTSDEP
ncbi:hypothetical protein C5F51_17120 [Nocardia nova]|uniref:Uncharacterized protein n=1 Tax=Nocardia nova TaxID=37330 RepID=A0A2S6A5Y0_9NOCA|nr:hypothetical protein C5F51_17120 [Nocardia nova]